MDRRTLMTSLIILIVLAVVAIVDLWLILTKRATISQAYQKQFPTWFDICTMLILMLGIIYSPLHPTIKVLLGVLAGHVFFPNKERFR